MFCLLKNAIQVPLDMIFSARRDFQLNPKALHETRLYKFIDVNVHKNFYSLKWQPGQSLESHSRCYYEIFDKPMKVLSDFMESTELNPF